MERNQVLVEYRKLCNLLNQGNKLANEMTEIKFTIESVHPSGFRLVLALTSDQENRKIELATCDNKGDWERSGLTDCKAFERQCAAYLNEQESLKKHLTKQIDESLDAVIIFMSKGLQKAFDELLINYFP